MFLDTNPLATLKLPGEMDEVPAQVSINAAELEPANLGESPCSSVSGVAEEGGDL